MNTLEHHSFEYVLLPFDEGSLGSPAQLAYDRQQLQADLEAQERLFSLLVDKVGDCIIATDTRGHVRFLNRLAQSLTGFSEKEAIGLPLQQILRFQTPHTDESSPCEAYLDIRQRFELPIGSCGITDKDGAEHIVCGTSVVVHDGRESLGLLFILRDLAFAQNTEQSLRETQRRLLRVREQLNQLGYALNHDLAEPIRTVSLCSQVLRRAVENDLDPESEEILRAMVAECTQMQASLALRQEADLPEEIDAGDK